MPPTYEELATAVATLTAENARLTEQLADADKTLNALADDEQKDFIAALRSGMIIPGLRAEIAGLRFETERYWQEEREVVDALAPTGVHFLDPSDGGLVALGTQVRRLVEDWNALRAENERLKVERSLAESRLNACEMVRDMVVLERDSALARLAQADADSVRLDWLEAQTQHGELGDVTLTRTTGVPEVPWIVQVYLGKAAIPVGIGTDLRAAIDAAARPGAPGGENDG
mgnify:CR=1 FL=1